MDISTALSFVRAKLKELTLCNAARSALDWDMETGMPPAASETRADVISFLAGLAHEMALDPYYVEALTFLREQVALGNVPADETANIALAWKAYEREARLPGDFVRELSNLTAVSHHVWAEARRQSDFGMFAPNLTRIIDLKREQARLLSSGSPPYDALLDEFEPGANTAAITAVLTPLRERLAALVAKIAGAAAVAPPPLIAAPLDAQINWNQRIAAMLGFDFQAGRLDASAHPFTAKLHLGDVRITTRYEPKDLLYSVMSTVHEAGHGMYDQGVPAADYGQPVGEAPSLGIHESQSRLWENLVARGRPFWQYFLPLLQADGFLPGVDVDSFHRSVNRVQPSFIRTEADEVTYNLHICLRFEIERDLIEGRLAVADVRDAWNAKMRELLGLEVTSDALGVLQDVHWSSGLIGYFPTYTIGNLYSAQLYATVLREMPDLEDRIRAGDFRGLLDWLHDRVHWHGSRYGAEQIIRRATGKGLDSSDFLAYIERKYGEIYRF